MTAWISLVVRLGLGAVFLAAGGLKVSDPNASIQAVQAYELLPLGLAEVLGLALPFLEIALGLLLVLGWATRLMAVVGALLMTAFIVGVGSAWTRGLSIDCGCFGGGGVVDPSDTRYLQEILRDLLFLAMALWLVRFPDSRLALERARGRPGDGGAQGSHDRAEDDPDHDIDHDLDHEPRTT